jgi:hypothetical protein
MIWWETLLLIEISHNFFGVIFTACFRDCEGFEYVNPIWIYQHYRVNIFGCVLLTVVYNLLCPIGSIIYWLYKLCTVGRR